MQILLATSNPHKRDEILAIFEACGAHGQIELATLADLETSIEEPIEDGSTFEANALIKARYYAAATERRCLADDSGLEVDALDGEPGVRSARYSGTEGERATVDLANNRLVLEKLEGTPAAQRTARFVCAMVLCDPPSEGEQVLAAVRGTMEGRLITADEAADHGHPERGRAPTASAMTRCFSCPSAAAPVRNCRRPKRTRSPIAATRRESCGSS